MPTDLVNGIVSEALSWIVGGIIGIVLTGLYAFLFPIRKQNDRIDSIEKQMGEMQDSLDELRETVQSQNPGDISFQVTEQLPAGLNPVMFQPLPWIGDEPQLDPGIAYAVNVLRSGGIRTIESCEGGEGHSFPQPIVIFEGPYVEGMRAAAIASTYRLPVAELRRTLRIREGRFAGPVWEMVFFEKLSPPNGGEEA